MNLGKVTTEVVKRFRGYKPQRFNAREVEVGEIDVSSFPQPDWLPALDNYEALFHMCPQVICCHYAFPHTDWNTWFLTISLAPRSWRFADTANLKGSTLDPGSVFIVNGGIDHWLYPINGKVGKAFWYGVQWEIRDDPNESPVRDMLVSYLKPLLADWTDSYQLAKTPYSRIHPTHDLLAQK